MKKVSNVALIALIVFSVFSFFIGIKLYNLGKAYYIVNKCFVIPSEATIFQVTGYQQRALEIRGTYSTKGLFFVIPFAQEVPQKNLELGIEKGYVQEYPCKEVSND